MTEIQKVIVIGATSNVVHPVVNALVLEGFTVTVGTRRPHAINNNSKAFPTSVSIKTADLEYVSSLAAAFAGQDAVVEAFNPATAHFQVNVIEAALQIGVKHIIKPDFSSDTFHMNAPELKIFEPKIEAQMIAGGELERDVSGRPN